MQLPDHITAIAYHASNGELAWKQSHIPAAVAAIAGQGMAILGGEVWMALGDGRWDGRIPSRDGSPGGVWGWDTTVRAEGESWQAFCERMGAELVRVAASMAFEDEVHPSVLDRLWINLCYVTETEHRADHPAWASLPPGVRRWDDAASGD